MGAGRLPSSRTCGSSKWGEFKLEWLRRLLPFERGLASHDTFSRVFAMLDSARFEACFRSWMAQICPSLGQEQRDHRDP